MTEQEVREIAGEAAFPRVWPMVQRAEALGYRPELFVDARGHAVLEITAVLSEWDRDDETEEEEEG